MFDHLGLHVTDVAASVAFYQAVMAPLGAAICSQDENGAGLGRNGNAVLWLYAHKGSKGPGAHVCFAASDRKAVEKFHAEGLKAGGKDNGGAGLRTDYSPTYFAAFLIDPDGNNVEAVYMGA